MAAKNLVKVNLSDLMKRVSKDQMNHFIEFKSKSDAYKARATKLPEKLPEIDWEYYRHSVRPQFVPMVEEFQSKYAEVVKAFETRDSLDTSKYYQEIEKQSAEVEADIAKYIEESNERIQQLECEYERIESLKPIEEMTWEEYCDLLPEGKAFVHEGKPTFWPHTEDELGVGAYGGATAHDHGEGESHAEGKTAKEAKPSEKEPKSEVEAKKSDDAKNEPEKSDQEKPPKDK